MSGGSTEYVMGNVYMGPTYQFAADSSGFSTSSASKYIDTYTNSANSYTAYQNGKLGDATKETLVTFGNTSGGWYGDLAAFPYSSDVWFQRGGGYDRGAIAGVFYFYSNRGGASGYYSFRVVLSAQ